MPEKYRPEGSNVEYTVPSLDDPADGPVAFRDFADSIPSALSPVIPIHNQAADYTLAISDDGSLVGFDCTAKDLNVTVPAHTKVDFPIGSVIVVGCFGTNRKGSLTIVAEDGVTLRDLAVRKVSWSRMAALIKIDQDSWIINAGTGGGTPTSVPSPPKLLTAAAGSMQIGITWQAPTDDGGSALSAYLVEISKDQKVWDTGASTSPTTLATAVPVSQGGITWYVRVKAVNANGVSDPSNVLSANVKPPYNEATGGTKTGTYKSGDKWFKWHLFETSGVLNVKQSVGPWQVAVAAGGGGSGVGNEGSSTNGAGGAGGLIVKNDLTLKVDSYDVVVGRGGGVAQNGESSRFSTLIETAGGGRGGGGAVGWNGAGGGSGGGGGGDNDASGRDKAPGIAGQGHEGDVGCYGGPGGGGGAGGPAYGSTDRYDPQGCQKGYGGPGVTVNMTGEPMVLSAGGRAVVGSRYGGGGGGGCGGSTGGGQNGVVIVTYEVGAP